MRMRHCFGSLLALTLLLAAAPARAQITINVGDIELPTTGLVRSITADATPGSLEAARALTATGPNRTWDFRTLQYEPLDTVSVQVQRVNSGGSTDPYFAQANYIWKTGDKSVSGGDSLAYVYMKLDANALYTYGIWTKGDFSPELPGDETFTLKFEPPSLDMVFPLTMGTNWTSNHALKNEFVPGFVLTTSFNEVNEVVGWGRLVTSLGSADALQLRTRQITTVDNPFGGPAVVDTTILYQWLTKSTVSATISADAQGNVVFADISVQRGAATASEHGDDVLPQRIALDQNYPNPFNPATSIPFELKTPSEVVLKVYDAMGREVATLVEGMRPAGRHVAAWNAAGLPSGVYLYRLQAGGEVIARSMTLLK